MAHVALVSSRDYTALNAAPSTKPGLLLVRLGRYAVQLARNDALRGYRLVHIDQAMTDVPQVTSLMDSPHVEYLEQAYQCLDSVITGFGITRVLASQPGFWYSRILAQVAAVRGVDVIWLETFFNGRVVLDRIGTVYTPDNEIARYADRGAVTPVPSLMTRLDQPTTTPRAFPDGVVVFGQVPSDMAVMEQPGLTYHQWLHALFTRNPDTPFVFKHHPQYVAPHLDIYPNVTVIEAPVAALIQKYAQFAAFSSSTILECVAARKPVVTGGYHALRGSGATLDAPTDLSHLSAQFAAHQPNRERANTWMAFLYHRYSLPLESPDVRLRLEMTSDAYFSR